MTGAVTVRIDVIASGDPKYPHRVRVTTRDAHGTLVGVRNHRATTEAEARDIAARLGEHANIEDKESAS